VIFDSNEILMLKFLPGPYKKKEFIIIFLLDNELLIGGISLWIMHQSATIIIRRRGVRIGVIRLGLRLL
jgi:hypothetical protein